MTKNFAIFILNWAWPQIQSDLRKVLPYEMSALCEIATLVSILLVEYTKHINVFCTFVLSAIFLFFLSFLILSHSYNTKMRSLTSDILSKQGIHQIADGLIWFCFWPVMKSGIPQNKYMYISIIYPLFG